MKSRSIYNYIEYRDWLLDLLKHEPNLPIDDLGLSRTQLMQILKGIRELNPKTLIRLTEVLEMNALEAEYLKLLVYLSKTTDPQSRGYFQGKIIDVRRRALNSRSSVSKFSNTL